MARKQSRPLGLRDSFAPILARVGLPQIRLYDLQHACATQLLLPDAPAKVVSERRGHSSITLTLDRYSHNLPQTGSMRPRRWGGFWPKGLRMAVGWLYKAARGMKSAALNLLPAAMWGRSSVGRACDF